MNDKFTIADSVYYDLATDLGVPPAAIRAVAEVESGGQGFLSDGRPAILFEAHIFSSRTKHAYDSSHPNISSLVWNRSLYKGGAKEWDRLEEARTLDVEAANASASWGTFQICGFNYAVCGYTSATEMATAMGESATNHVIAFAKFIKGNNRMVVALRTLDWSTFAGIYNGPGQVAYYAAKIQAAYVKFAPTFGSQPQPQQIQGLISSEAQAANEGPPIPVTDTSSPPPSALSSKTIIASTVAAGTTGASVLTQATDIFNTVQQTSSSANGAVGSLTGTTTLLGSILSSKALPLILSVIAILAVAYVIYHYVNKIKTGQVIKS